MKDEKNPSIFDVENKNPYRGQKEPNEEQAPLDPTVEAILKRIQEPVEDKILRDIAAKPDETGESTSLSSKDKFDQTLRAISEHIFVSDKTKQKRQEMEELVNKLRAKMDSPETKIVAIPCGSLAVGLANEESDYDGVIFFQQDPKSEQDLESEYLTMSIPFEAAQLELENYPRVLETAFTDKVIDTYLAGPQSESDMEFELISSQLHQAALVFAPALGEFSTTNNKAVVTEWRKQFLEKLLQTHPDKATVIWDKLRSYLKDSFVNYEENDSGGMVDKRRERVSSTIKTAVSKRFPGNEIAQKRASQFIERKRQNFSYPSLDEMVDIFQLSIPSTT